jgi:beta-glucosidase/6-phospho-beta-glucosidase/beta-galactosidase
MWIGENGISDAKDTLREEYLKKHLWVVSHALNKGYDIKGYHVWTLLDSFNWKSGFADKYGIFEVDFESTEKTRTLRKGAQCFIDLAKSGRYA